MNSSEENTVFVVAPEADRRFAAYIGSPRLVHPEQAADFVKEVSNDDNTATSTYQETNFNEHV